MMPMRTEIDIVKFVGHITNITAVTSSRQPKNFYEVMRLSWTAPKLPSQPGAGFPLAYRIPREPSRLRATAWRRIKALGTIYLHNSVAALHDSWDNERALRTLRREIIELGGTA